MVTACKTHSLGSVNSMRSGRRRYATRMSFGVTLTFSIQACHAQSLVSCHLFLAALARITGVYVSSNVRAKSAVTRRPKHTMHLER